MTYHLKEYTQFIETNKKVFKIKIILEITKNVFVKKGVLKIFTYMSCDKLLVLYKLLFMIIFINKFI